MKKILLIFAVTVLVISCNQDDKPAEVLLQEVEFGAIIRTLNINNSEFNINDPQSVFNIDIEEQDAANGEFFEAIDVYLSFKDNTVTGQNYSRAEVFLESLSPSTFSQGPPPARLPRRTINYSFAQLMESLSLNLENISCKDQFIIRMELRLTDGSIYNTDNANALIIAQNTFYSSPFSYTVNVVEPIVGDVFLGNYVFETIVEGPLGETFTGPNPVEIVRGHSNNNRKVKLNYRTTRRPPRDYDFTIVCDEIVIGENLLSSTIGKCRLDQPDTGDLILLGPGMSNAIINPTDDSVFELSFVEGYRDWDGDCGFSNFPAKIRFTKQ